MSKQARFVLYGLAVLLIAVGTACAVAFSGVTGQVVAIVLVGSGLVILTGLVFMEVGLSEDRERARNAQDPAASSARRRLDPARPPRLRGPRHGR